MRRLLSCLTGVSIASGALGIAVDDLQTSEVSPTNTISAYNTFNWDYAYKYNGSSSVAVDHYWILTAGHVAVASATISVNGEIYTQQEFVKHAQADDPDGNPTADLALIRFDKPFPGYYPLHNSIPTGEDVLVVGFGFPGDVVRSRFNGYFTEDRAGSRIKRWGTNKIDGTSTVFDSKGFDFTISGTSGNSGTTYEVGCNDKDSGSGVFYWDGSVWKLVGTLANRYSTSTSGQYAGNFAVGTHHYINWIKSVIVDYDTDMDGLPDWWELQYGGDEMSMDASGDLDSDGYTNLDEWYSDTDPTNGVSFLDVDYVPPASVRISNGSVDRAYQIQRRTDLANTNATWQVDLDWFDGTGTQMVQAVTSTPSNGFYRVRARLP